MCQVTGLDGNYRITCHTVMEVLREHRDSVMAVLEAFVYDPLLNWRLMDSKGEKKQHTDNLHAVDSIKNISINANNKELEVNEFSSVK